MISNRDPRQFGIALDREDFADAIVRLFNQINGGQVSVDEMLLSPRVALAFCDRARELYDWPQATDSLILASLMGRRKNPLDGRPVPAKRKK